MISFNPVTTQQLAGVLKQNYQLSSALLASCISLSLMAPSYAGERIRWTPDSDRGSIESTLSGGRRGQTSVSCNPANNATQLALLVPDTQSRLLTTTANPTLAWYITTAAPVEMTFHFADPDLATPIYTRTTNLEKTTIVSVTLPEEYSLTADKRYRWTVFVSCPGDYQTEISARSFVEYVDGEFLDVNHLSSLEQARVYADQGIWYNAVALLLTAGAQGVTDAATMVQSLLEQGQSPAEITLSAVVYL